MISNDFRSKLSNEKEINKFKKTETIFSFISHL